MRYTELSAGSGRSRQWAPVARFAFPLFFIAAGAVHFGIPEFYASKLPESVPYKIELIYLAGAAEIGAGLLAAFPRTRRIGALFIGGFLTVVIGINVLHLARLEDSAVPWIRVLFLAALATWAYATAHRAREPRNRSLRGPAFRK